MRAGVASRPGRRTVTRRSAPTERSTRTSPPVPATCGACAPSTTWATRRRWPGRPSSSSASGPAGCAGPAGLAGLDLLDEVRHQQVDLRRPLEVDHVGHAVEDVTAGAGHL